MPEHLADESFLAKVILAGDPAAALEAAPKQYIDTRAVPVGGATGQMLVKSSGTDYALTWSDVAAGRAFYFVPSDTSDIATYKTLLETPSAGAEQTVPVTVSGTGDILVGVFATEPGVPGAVYYPAGTANRRFWVSVSAGTARLHMQIYSRTAAGVETLVRDEFSPNFTNTSVALVTWMSTMTSGASMETTDRLVAKLYAQRVAGSASFTVTVYFEGTANASHVLTTLAVQGSGSGGGLDQATADTRYVNISGDTMTGLLRVDNAPVQLDTTGTWYPQRFSLSGVARWELGIGGSGNRLDLDRLNVSGVYLDSPLSIEHATGRVTVTGDPTAALGVATKQYVDNRTPKITVSTTAPSSPAVGDLWVDTSP